MQYFYLCEFWISLIGNTKSTNCLRRCLRRTFSDSCSNSMWLPCLSVMDFLWCTCLKTFSIFSLYLGSLMVTWKLSSFKDFNLTELFLILSFFCWMANFSSSTFSLQRFISVKTFSFFNRLFSKTTHDSSTIWQFDLVWINRICLSPYLKHSNKLFLM